MACGGPVGAAPSGGGVVPWLGGSVAGVAEAEAAAPLPPGWVGPVGLVGHGIGGLGCSVRLGACSCRPVRNPRVLLHFLPRLRSRPSKCLFVRPFTFLWCSVTGTSSSCGRKQACPT